jgi:elongator complex protein 1
MPYIQSLQEMPILRKQFTIDSDLGWYKRAMSHLYALDGFEELQNYAEKHELHAAAIELYKYQPERLNQLMRLYGDFLSSRNRFKEAGVGESIVKRPSIYRTDKFTQAYEYLNDYASAFPAYRSANMWREALSCATLVPLSAPDLASLARDLADGLMESKDFQGAARIHMEYLSDIEQGVRLLCKSYQFADAMRVVALQGRLEMMESVIDAGLVDGFNSTLELLADCKAQIGAQVPRLRDLRVKKEQEPCKLAALGRSSIIVIFG